MARIPVDVGNVICPDDVTPPKDCVTLAGVRHQICAGVQDPMCPVRATPKAAVDHPAVDIALSLADADGGKDLEVRIVQQVGALLEQRNLS